MGTVLFPQIRSVMIVAPSRRNAGVEAQFVVGRCGELSFACGDELEPRGDLLGLELALGEVQIQLEVARFGALELFVQIAHLLRQPFGEQAKALAGARFDQRVHDHEIELALGLMRAHQLAQLARVAPGLHAPVRHVELLHEALDLLEMLELFARQPRQRHAQASGLPGTRR